MAKKSSSSARTHASSSRTTTHSHTQVSRQTSTSRPPSTSSYALSTSSHHNPSPPSTRQIQTIQPSQLGFSSSSEIATFQRYQQAALRNNSGPAAQAAAQGRVLVDGSSLGLLANHFDQVMGVIRRRADVLNQHLSHSVQRQQASTTMSIQSANEEIARMHSLLRQIDELETEFDKIRHIRDIVAGFRSRVELLERRLG